MSHYLHYVVEYQEHGTWKPFSMAVNADTETQTKYENDTVLINGVPSVMCMDFVTNYTELRDYYFSANPWKSKEIFCKGIPADATDATRTYLKKVMDDGCHLYNCRLDEIVAERKRVMTEYLELKKTDDIMQFSTEFAMRLGYGKPNSKCVSNLYDCLGERYEKMDNLELLLHALYSFVGAVLNMVALVTDSYALEPEYVRVVLWTD